MKRKEEKINYLSGQFLPQRWLLDRCLSTWPMPRHRAKLGHLRWCGCGGCSDCGCSRVSPVARLRQHRPHRLSEARFGACCSRFFSGIGFGYARTGPDPYPVYPNPYPKPEPVPEPFQPNDQARSASVQLDSGVASNASLQTLATASADLLARSANFSVTPKAPKARTSPVVEESSVPISKRNETKIKLDF